MPILRLPGTLCSLSDEFLLSIHSLPDIPAAMLDWELHVHPKEREMTRMSNEWFARLNPRQCPTGLRSYFSLCTAINYFRPTYTRNGQPVNSHCWLQCVSQMHLMTSYGAYCSPNAFIWLTPSQTECAWIIQVSYSPTMTSWMSLATMKRRNTCTTPVAPKRPPKCSCIFLRNRKNSNQSTPSLYSRPSTSKPSSRLPTPANRPCSTWIRFSRDATPNQQRRFIDTCQAYVHATQEQVVNRLDQTCPSIESYVELRRHTSAIWVGGSPHIKHHLTLDWTS